MCKDCRGCGGASGNHKGRVYTLGCKGCSNNYLPLGYVLCHCGVPGIPFTPIKGQRGCPTCSFRGIVKCMRCGGTGNEIMWCTQCNCARK